MVTPRILCSVFFNPHRVFVQQRRKDWQLILILYTQYNASEEKRVRINQDKQSAELLPVGRTRKQ